MRFPIENEVQDQVTKSQRRAEDCGLMYAITVTSLVMPVHQMSWL